MIKIKTRFCFGILTFVFLLSGASVSLYAETVWVTEYGPAVPYTKQLLKVTANGKKQPIKFKNFSSPTTIEVDQKDGSVWVNDLNEPFNHQIAKLSSSGRELFRLSGFIMLGDSAIDYKDGSYFAVERMTGEVIKISSDGKELFRIKDLSPVKDLEGMGCLKNIEGCHAVYRGTDINLEGIDDVGISPVDSSIWVADTGGKRLLKFTKQGEKITQKRGIGEPEHLDIAPDGTCWVNNIERGRVFKISSDGRRILAKITGLNTPFELSVSPIDNTCWVTTSSALVQISADGKKILRTISGFSCLQGISTINPVDGSFWIADYFGGEIIKLSPDGKILKRIGGFKRPRFSEVYWDN